MRRTRGPIRRAGRRSPCSGREAALAAITTDTPAVPAPGPIGAAVALQAALSNVTVLSSGEQALMREWLDRIAAG